MWRIWDKPNSLLAQILKHRYFATSEFLDCGVGTRPSYGWQSILHGRELLKQGLQQVIGNGLSTEVWLDNWLLEDIPRPPRYQQDTLVDLTMEVWDLIDAPTHSWNRDRVRQFIHEDDVELVLQTKFSLTMDDSMVWALSANGSYNTRSSYKLLETLQDRQSNQTSQLPPLERQLWNNLWKTKAPPKLKHFMWRALSGALAVRQRLSTRGITLNTTCTRCGMHEESICHVLFQCKPARETWQRSGFPLPPGGFSRSSVFLNFYHLITESRKQNSSVETRRRFPWILWQIWKARNAFCFENTRAEAEVIFNKAQEDTSSWFHAQSAQSGDLSCSRGAVVAVERWKPPPCNMEKCNVDASWHGHARISGAPWITRDSKGQAVSHSRRSYSGVNSLLEAELLALFWAIESLKNLRMKKVILEISSKEVYELITNSIRLPRYWQVLNNIRALLYNACNYHFMYVHHTCNRVASEVATSVTRDLRLQSYVASGGPSWLSSLILLEAVTTGQDQ